MLGHNTLLAAATTNHPWTWLEESERIHDVLCMYTPVFTFTVKEIHLSGSTKSSNSHKISWVLKYSFLSLSPE